MSVPAAVRPATVAAIERLAPMCDEFERALRVDLGYSIEIAIEHRKLSTLRDAWAVRLGRDE